MVPPWIPFFALTASQALAHARLPLKYMPISNNVGMQAVAVQAQTVPFVEDVKVQPRESITLQSYSCA